MALDNIQKKMQEHQNKVFTPRVMAVLEDPGRASVFRCYDNAEDRHGWTGYGGEAKRIAKPFSDKTKFFDKYLCIFHPDAAFEFSKGEDVVRITCCFSCTEVKVELNGEITGFIAMVSVRGDVLALVKEFFGSDPYIKNIPVEKR